MEPRTLIVGQFAERLLAAPKGERGPIVQEACKALQCKPATFYRAVNELYPRGRRLRADAGDMEFPLQEAQVLSAYASEGYRKNGKKTISVETAVADLVANGRILAGRVDPHTGEVMRFSMSTIHRCLRAYGLHPEQLRKPTPHVNMRSLHPNHVWQVDGSVCVLFYLPGEGSEVVPTDQAVHYKNKPENLKAIERARVIRYVLTDHCTNVTRWRYYPHAETAAHTVHFLAWAMAPKDNPNEDPFHGVPRILMVDPGATAGGLVKRFCQRMGIDLIVNERRRPRAKGSAEQGQNRVETAFEQGLRCARAQVSGFDSLNRLADIFQLHYNATAEHTRHKMTRFEAWMHIRHDELIVPQSADVLLSLATDKPMRRVVAGDLSVEFKGRRWDVEHVPGALVGDEVFVHWHPFIAETAMAVTLDDHGTEVHHPLTCISGRVAPRENEWGFAGNSVVIGQKHRARKDTLIDTNRKLTARIAAGEATQEEADRKRERRDFVPFNGEIDPYLRAKTEALPEYLLKRGTEHDVRIPRFEQQHLNAIQSMRYVRGRLGPAWKPEFSTWLQERFGESGATESQLDNLIRQWAGSDTARAAGI